MILDFFGLRQSKSKYKNLEKENKLLKSKLKKLKYENKVLLSNYKNFIPKNDNQIKAYVLNDTRRNEVHLGCSKVMENLELLCRNHNINIIYYDSNYPDSCCSIENYKNIIAQSDILIFNGEGTLHDDRGELLFQKCELAKKLGKKIILLNAVWQNNSLNLKYLDLFDIISVRESKSFEEITKNTSKEVFIVPDMTFYGEKINNDLKKRAIIVTDSVYTHLTNKLKNFAEKNHYEMYYLTAKNENILSEEVISNLNSESLIITGRFHVLTMAMKYGIPCAAFPSNTHKIEGLFHDSGLPKEFLLDENLNISSQVELLKNNKEYTDNFKVMASKYSENAKYKIDEFFNNVERICI
ncbi:polysaccharide pyruvyl transferase family protein [bacterium]|nr:polysaccharide pyruvyl transferase family protein [bacterium]